MLQNLGDLRGYELNARDGNIGHCADFLFDDDSWAVRYMVADTGTWLPGRKVLVSPISLGEIGQVNRIFSVKLTKEQIESSPPLEEDAPVSRQYESRWYRHYAWPSYWVGAEPWGPAAYPAALYAQGYPETDVDMEQEEPEAPGESHLRSVKEVEGYYIHAQDGKIGHVETFLMEDPAWILRYMVVDTRNFLPGKKVLVAPEWTESIDWSNRSLSLNMTTDKIKDAPEYDPAMTIDREYEEALHDFYRFPPYWL